MTDCTGHMGNTFRRFDGGVDAVEGVFGDAKGWQAISSSREVFFNAGNPELTEAN